MENRFVSINKFIKTIIEEEACYKNAKYVNVYFDDWIESKYYKGTWSIRPIGFSVINEDHSVENIPFAFVRQLFKDMEFIQFKENKEKNMKGLPYQKKLFKLVISTNETTYGNFTYYKSILKDVDQKLYKGKLEEYKQAIQELICGGSNDELPSEAFPDLD